MAVDKNPDLARAEDAFRAKRFGEADGICRDILRRHPGDIGAKGIRGLLAAHEGDIDRAIEMLEPAIAADPQNPNWRSTLADVYRMVYRFDEALVLAREAIALLPRQAPFLVNLGKVHYDRGELDDAILHFLGALAIDPDNANAHLGIGQILLARQEWRAGWIEYEWRNRLEQAQGRYPDIKAPLWNGMQLQGRILLIADQGFGDTLQFARYIPLVAARCTEVVVGCAEDLRTLMAGVPGVGRVFNEWRDIPGFTAYQLLSSLPYIFGTDANSIPPGTGYIRVPEERQADWRRWLQAGGQDGRAVGFFWSGRPTHPNNLRRSMRLEHFLPITQISSVRLICLQKEIPPGDRDALRHFPNTIEAGSRFKDFADTAALIENLDLVITVDSAVAHLAGTLGKPVWMLTACPSDWRWLLDRTDTPWYPSMRIFRQPKAGDWDSVIADVVSALQQDT